MARRTGQHRPVRTKSVRVATTPPELPPDTGRVLPAATQPDPELVLPLLGEDVAVTTRVVETGRVSIRRVTRVESKPIAEGLARETVEISRVPIGREVEHMPPIRQEGDTLVIPVVEERLVIERRLLLKEEVRVRRVRSRTVHRENVPVRHHDIVIDRKPADDEST